MRYYSARRPWLLIVVVAIALPGCGEVSDPPNTEREATTPPDSSTVAPAKVANAASPSAESEETVTVDIKNFKFEPATITVEPGTKVRWINRDDSDHDVTSGKSITGREARNMEETKFPDGRFESGLFGPGKRFSVTFEKSGRYPYYCNIHPFMVGRVVVQ